jgi:hypothetical protein
MDESASGRIDVGRLLNVVGVGFVVTGAVLALSYGWQFLGPWLRVLLGMIGAFALVGSGEQLGIKFPNIRWFGQGLVGGGYAFGFFVIYAMQNVQPLKIIDSASIDVLILMLLSALAMWHAGYRQSPTIAGISAILGLVTITLNEQNLASLACIGVLSAGLSILIAREKWWHLHLINCVAPFVALFCSGGHFLQSGHPQIWLSIGALAVVWLTNVIVSLALSETREHVNAASYATAVNALIFVAISIFWLDAEPSIIRFLFLSTVGAFYLRITKLFGKRHADMAILSKMLGLTFSTAAFPVHLSHDYPAIFVTETALLVWFGLKYNQGCVRVFGAGLGLISWIWVCCAVFADHQMTVVYGIECEWRFVVGMLAIMSYGLATWMYRDSQFQRQLSTNELVYVSNLYAFLTCTISVMLPFVVQSTALATVCWPITGILLIAIGFRTNDLAYRVIGLSFFAAIAAKLLFFDERFVGTIQRSISFVVAGLAFLMGSYSYAWLGNKVKQQVHCAGETGGEDPAVGEPIAVNV